MPLKIIVRTPVVKAIELYEFPKEIPIATRCSALISKMANCLWPPVVQGKKFGEPEQGGSRGANE